MRNALLGTDLEHGRPGDAVRARLDPPSGDNPVLHHEDVGGIGLGDEAVSVQHESVVDAPSVGLDLGENRIEKVVVMDPSVEDIRRRAPIAAGRQSDPALVIHGRFELGEDDERRTRLVEPRVHAGCDLLAAGQGQTDVDAIPHAVRFQRSTDLRDDLGVGGNPVERERFGGRSQPRQVLVELEDPAGVEPQSLPHRVAALHCRVERTHPGFVTVRKLAIDVDEQVAVAFVEALEHQAVNRWENSWS